MDTYVTNTAWQRTGARPDTIDDVADQFERPIDSHGASLSRERADEGWPSQPQPWDLDRAPDRLRLAG